MTLAPEVAVTRGTLTPSRSFDTDTGKLLLLGLSERGPIDAVTDSLSQAQWVSQNGGRQTDTTNYDNVEAFFGEGGARIVHARVAGPSATKAKRNLLDTNGAVCLVAQARGVGSYANGFTIQITHPTGNTFQAIVVGTRGDGSALTETSPEFNTVAEAVAWGSGTAVGSGFTLVTLEAGATALDPVVLAASALNGTTSGTDDRASITSTEIERARDLFGDDVLAGQIVYGGVTASATHALVQEGAEDEGRFALLDAPDSHTVGTITGVAAADRALYGAPSAGMYAPWLTIPPLVEGAAVRPVSPAVVAAALMARSDGAGNSPNRAAAAANGRLRYCTGLTQLPWTKEERATLSDAGVNVFRKVAGGIELYDNVTLANPATDPDWTEVGNARFYCLLRAEGKVALEQFHFDEIDGPYPTGHIYTRVRSALTAVLARYSDSMYGATPSEKYVIDLTGNTAETAAAKKLVAKLGVRMSRAARRVELAITNVPPTSSVA